jgi:hypothetical protein
MRSPSAGDRRSLVSARPPAKRQGLIFRLRRTNDHIVIHGAHARGHLGSYTNRFPFGLGIHNPPQLDRSILHDHIDQ